MSNEGRLPFRGRELTITQVSVEEDSCREVSDRGHLIVWRTDRLGMPLIETVTGPELRTPDEVEEAILLVGRVCRSTGHVRVGLGASRQDVNVSVAGGRRVEIKGVDNHRRMPLLVHVEAFRQLNLLRIRAELHRRGVNAGMLDLPQLDPPWESPLAIDARPLLREAAATPLYEARERGDMQEMVEVASFSAIAMVLMGKPDEGRRVLATAQAEWNPGRYLFGDVWACFGWVAILLHEAEPEEAVARAKEALPDCEVILMTGHGTVPSAVEAMQRGAFTYLEKPVDIEEYKRQLEARLGPARELMRSIMDRARRTPKRSTCCGM